MISPATAIDNKTIPYTLELTCLVLSGNMSLSISRKGITQPGERVMSDTPDDVETRYREMILAQSPAQRLAMASRMFATAKALIRAGILKEHKIVQEVEIRKHIFLRLYGNDFKEPEKTKILNQLTAK